MNNFLLTQEFLLGFLGVWTLRMLLIVTVRLVGWEISVPFQHKMGYIENKVLGGDLVPPG